MILVALLSIGLREERGDRYSSNFQLNPLFAGSFSVVPMPTLSREASKSFRICVFALVLNVCFEIVFDRMFILTTNSVPRS